MLILCSASKTRANILKEHNIKFLQKKCEFDESMIKTNNIYEFVTLVSLGKFKKCLNCFKNNDIIAADTIVTDGKQILLKAKDKEEARKFLMLQSNNKIKIITSMWVFFEDRIYHRLDETIYYFKKFDKENLKKYLDSNEWRGKAGACMVEGFCKKYIKKVKGYESTAKGLCVEELIKIIGDKYVN